MATYYRRFVKDFAGIARPLCDLSGKNSIFKWTGECQDAFERLKSMLTGAGIMAYPLTAGGQFVLDTDASGKAIGGVLSQVQDGKKRVVPFASRTLNKAERNFCVTDRELLAVRNFVEYFRHYLLGRGFILRTDHQALKWLFSLNEPKGRVARWIEVLSTYVFEVQYRPGKKHGNADVLSRCPDDGLCDCGVNELMCGPCKKCSKWHYKIPADRTKGQVRGLVDWIIQTFMMLRLVWVALWGRCKVQLH